MRKFRDFITGPPTAEAKRRLSLGWKKRGLGNKTINYKRYATGCSAGSVIGANRS